MEFIKAFVVGGLICVVGQILMDTTKLTPARILVIFVTLGAILGAFGIYDKIVEFGGAGAGKKKTYGKNAATTGSGVRSGTGREFRARTS